MSMIAQFKTVPVDTLTVNTGTPTGGIADIQHWQDGNQLAIAEVTGIPGIRVTLTFANIPSGLLYLYILGWYEGSSTHYVNIEMWNYDTSAWDIFGNMPLNYSPISHMSPFLDDTNYISSGAAQVRLNHPVTGNASHDMYVRHVCLLY